MDLEGLKKFAPFAKPEVLETILDNLDKFEEFGLDTAKKRQMWFAQMAHESGGFRWLEELGGNARAEKMYGFITRVGKMLGNVQPGDGARYKGRGIIQLTGKDNYTRYNNKLSEYLTADIIKSPEAAAEPFNAFIIALAYWKEKGCSAYAENGDIRTVTRKINGGYNGLQDRIAWYAKAQRFIT